jgi:hypothetical protein
MVRAGPSRSFSHKVAPQADLDDQLISFVNILGCVIFVAIAAYHYVRAAERVAAVKAEGKAK